MDDQSFRLGDHGRYPAKLMPETIRTYGGNPSCGGEHTARAFDVVRYAHDSATALLKAFYDIKGQRAATRGAATDEETDILRAMVVTAGAAVDSSLKQLFRDTLRELAEHDENVQSELSKFIARELAKLEGSPKLFEHLANSFIADHPFYYWADRYVYKLTGSSLQSSEQLFTACAALGLEPAAVGLNATEIKEIFDMRNQIVHEMDIDFSAARRNRRPRSVGTTTEATNKLLELAERIVQKTDDNLCALTTT